MAKPPSKSGRPWTPDDTRALRKLAGENTPTRVMALKLGRSPTAVQSKAVDLGVSLKPANQSPYNRQK